jgi:hypothetical protein
MVDAWFAGYPEGVRAAGEDGAGAFRSLQIPTSYGELLEPTTDPWAEYASPESGAGPPVISGQEMEMPPLPESMPTDGADAYGSPYEMDSSNPAFRPMESQPSTDYGVPLSSGRQVFSWGRIR